MFQDAAVFLFNRGSLLFGDDGRCRVAYWAPAVPRRIITGVVDDKSGIGTSENVRPLLRRSVT